MKISQKSIIITDWKATVSIWKLIIKLTCQNANEDSSTLFSLRKEIFTRNPVVFVIIYPPGNRISKFPNIIVDYWVYEFPVGLMLPPITFPFWVSPSATITTPWQSPSTRSCQSRLCNRWHISPLWLLVIVPCITPTTGRHNL